MIQNGKRIDVFRWYKKRSLPGLIHLPDILIPQLQNDTFSSVRQARMAVQGI
jgi:hypothetical protein